MKQDRRKNNMAVKGTAAKSLVENKIKEAFGADFIGIVDKKIYVWSQEGGEKVQVCLALTCPKVPIEAPEPVAANEPKATEFTWNTPTVKEPCAWGAKPAAKEEPKQFTPPTEMSKEERDRIEALMARLGL
jgi:hypothetical protein